MQWKPLSYPAECCCPSPSLCKFLSSLFRTVFPQNIRRSSSLCTWFSPFIKLSSRFIHSVASDQPSCFLKAELYFTVHGNGAYLNPAIHWPGPTLFCTLIIFAGLTMNMRAQTSPQPTHFNFFAYLLRNKIARHMLILYLAFEHSPHCFPKLLN